MGLLNNSVSDIYHLLLSMYTKHLSKFHKLFSLMQHSLLLPLFFNYYLKISTKIFKLHITPDVNNICRMPIILFIFFKIYCIFIPF